MIADRIRARTATRLVAAFGLVVMLLAILAAQTARAQPQVTLIEGTGQLVSLPREASSVFVGDPSVADVQAVSGRSLYLSGVGPGVTNVIALDFEDQAISQYIVQVVADTRAADALVSDRAPGGNVGVRSNDDVAIVYGTAGNVGQALGAAAARRALEADGRIAVDRTEIAGGTQVSLRVRFVEGSRSTLNSLGVDLAAVNSGNPVIRVLTGSGDASDFVQGATSVSGGIGAGFGYTDGDADIDGVLRALERRGIVQILSEPTLTTTSGRRASFQAGGEFAFPVPQGDGVVTAEYRSFGVSIEFLPTVLPNDRIALDVAPEVSFIDPEIGVNVGDFAAPSLSVRRAETTVEVGSGQTFAIAGLYEQFASDSSESLPGLAGNRVFGPLFGGRSSRRDERELVIFITPYLAAASDAATRARNATVPLVDTVGFIAD